MIILEPYINERDVYSQVPSEHHWIFNKLELCRRLGYGPYGPVGTITPPGTYCVRPIVNTLGGARGGFRKVVMEKEGYIWEPVGHCYTPWNDGPRGFHEYVNDELWHSQLTTYVDDDGWETSTPQKTGPELPEPLCGISRYMLVETLGDMVIDVSPRHLIDEQHQDVIDDYQQFCSHKYEQDCSLLSDAAGISMRAVWNTDMNAYTIEERENAKPTT